MFRARRPPRPILKARQLLHEGNSPRQRRLSIGWPKEPNGGE